MDPIHSKSVALDTASYSSALSTNRVAACFLGGAGSQSVQDALDSSRETRGVTSQNGLWPLPSRQESTAYPRLLPAPPPEWEAAVQYLTEISRAPALTPSWWTPKTALQGGLENTVDPDGHPLELAQRVDWLKEPTLYLQLTMAGWGHIQLAGETPQRARPGNAFFSTAPSHDRSYLPAQSPGWTFGWIGLSHPYLVTRLGKLVATAGPRFDVPPDSWLAACALRLIRGAIKKDFCDQFELELELFRFVLACERWAQGACANTSGGQRLLDEVRARIVASLPKAIGVDALAAEYGMSRCHFSHFFRNRTGVTPAHFATEVRVHEAARMLRDTREPLKWIADACGFANANHFCKVFRRFRHLSPKSYRQSTL
jgi:AraC-like DNA-binding protein